MSSSSLPSAFQIQHSISFSRSSSCFPSSTLHRLRSARLALLLNRSTRRSILAMTSAVGEARMKRIASSIRAIPDFPKPGVTFQDITTLLLDPMAFRDTVDLFVESYVPGRSKICGVEARGFIFGPPIALAIGAKFVPLRKPKKLPGDVISEEYSLEYGTDKIEMHVGAVQPNDRAIIIDDLIATGGTLCAAIKLIERVGAEVIECACVIELPELKPLEANSQITNLRTDFSNFKLLHYRKLPNGIWLL
ncbi:Adenine phosphoribosyltransferase 1 [Apostasia shenzhenica]|uniref:adenine phosphoribosyltransferase n=1 Tax=Apostasia shenzhenica TaxID=1088818 RepID=A0A2I0BDS5_9ASPA|nr:Adenine phosphoribosyltransferase 1 [Apostasia shenzhenica]